jgi:dienelactone hydrolase
MSAEKPLGRSAGFAALLSMSLLLGANVVAQTATPLPWRIEILPVPSKTISGGEFLRGNSAGRDVVLGGELRLPLAMLQGKVPAVVLIHGSGGIASNADAWARALNEVGIAAFILDTFSGRSIVSTVEDQSQLDSMAMMIDAFRALDVLAAHRAIRADKIAVMGFSKGAVAAVFSSSTRFKGMHGSANTFAAHIGMYTPCNTRFADDTKVSRAPIRLFHGIADDYVSIAPCRDFVVELKAAGADISLTEYADSNHAFDVPTYPPLLEIKKAQSTRNCRLKEGPDGVILNAATMVPYVLKSDPCVAVGAHIGYNPASTAAAREAVALFLKQVLLN